MNPAPLGLRGCYSRPAAAEYLSVSAVTIDRLIADGHLATFTPRGMRSAVMISRTALDRYIAECELPVEEVAS